MWLDSNKNNNLRNVANYGGGGWVRLLTSVVTVYKRLSGRPVAMQGWGTAVVCSIIRSSQQLARGPLSVHPCPINFHR